MVFLHFFGPLFFVVPARDVNLVDIELARHFRPGFIVKKVVFCHFVKMAYGLFVELSVFLSVHAQNEPFVGFIDLAVFVDFEQLFGIEQVWKGAGFAGLAFGEIEDLLLRNSWKLWLLFVCAGCDVRSCIDFVDWCWSFFGFGLLWEVKSAVFDVGVAALEK